MANKIILTGRTTKNAELSYLMVKLAVFLAEKEGK